VEYIYSLGDKKDYPHGKLDELWKLLLLNQFHDILPGSSIHQVYENTHREYEQCISGCEKMLSNLSAGKSADKDENRNPVLTLVNILSFPYDDLVSLPTDWKGHVITDSQGGVIQTQADHGQLLARVLIAPQSQYLLQKGAEKSPRNRANNCNDLILENEYVCYKFDDSGAVISAYDKKEQREFITSARPGNVLQIFTDKPLRWDAWDFEIYIRENLDSILSADPEKTIISTGPVFSSIEFHYTYNLNVSGN